MYTSKLINGLLLKLDAPSHQISIWYYYWTPKSEVFFNHVKEFAIAYAIQQRYSAACSYSAIPPGFCLVGNNTQAKHGEIWLTVSKTQATYKYE